MGKGTVKCPRCGAGFTGTTVSSEHLVKCATKAKPIPTASHGGAYAPFSGADSEILAAERSVDVAFDAWRMAKPRAEKNATAALSQVRERVSPRNPVKRNGRFNRVSRSNQRGASARSAHASMSDLALAGANAFRACQRAPWQDSV